MDPIGIGCMNSSILQSRTCVWPVVSQPLGACNPYRAPSLKSLRPCNNIQLFSLKKLSDSQRIMNISSKLSWTWDHRWVVRVRLFLAVSFREQPASSFSSCASIIQFFFIQFFFINYFLFLFNFFLIITDRYTDRHNPLIYSREFETIYFICHYNIVTSLTE
jgi:hypothetical protein